MQARFLTLFSSSKGNAAYIKYGRDEILIDCGVSAVMIERALRSVGSSLANISALFITHEHGDHIRGLPVICRKVGMPVFAPVNSCAYLEPSVANAKSRLHPLVSLQPVELFDTVVCPIKTPHDSLDSCGFRIKAGDEKLGYFTDIGHLSENILRGLSGCRRVVIESNHDIEMLKRGSYPAALKRRILGENGHLSNDACSKLLPHLAEHGTESVALAHLSEENNRPLVALAAAFSALDSAGVLALTAEREPVADIFGQDPVISPAASMKVQVAPTCGAIEL